MSESVKQIDNDGTRSWRINGQLHRTGGPAVEWPNGSREWWVRRGCRVQCCGISKLCHMQTQIIT